MFLDAKQLSFVATFLGLVAQWIEQQISNLSVKSSNLFKFTILMLRETLVTKNKVVMFLQLPTF